MAEKNEGGYLVLLIIFLIGIGLVANKIFDLAGQYIAKCVSMA